MADLDRLLRADVADLAAEHARAPDFDMIQHRGRQLRRRRHLLIGGALAAALVIAAVALGQVLPGRPDAAPIYPVDAPTSSLDRPTGPWTALRAPTRVVGEQGQWLDEADTLNGAMDIRRILVDEFGGFGTQDDFLLELADRYPAEAVLESAGQVIEYGVVIDTDGDLKPDCHVGISNENESKEPGDFHVWVKNLQTGRTQERVGGPYGFPFDFSHPLEGGPEEDGAPAQMRFFFLTSTPTPCNDYGAGDLMYAYSSLTEQGQVTSWDFIPDNAWLRLQ